MHKDDQMTPKERAFALFAGKPVDRMPIKLFSPYIGMNFGGILSRCFRRGKITRSLAYRKLQTFRARWLKCQLPY